MIAPVQDGWRSRSWYLTSLWWRTLKISYYRHYGSGGVFMAAAIAFYSLICLGPLGIMVASLLQRLLGGGSRPYQILHQIIRDSAGGAAEQIMKQIDGLLAHPGSYLASVASTAALVWAGLRLFEIIELSLTAVWPGRRFRPFYARKLVSLLMMIVAGLMLAAMVIAHLFLATVEVWLARLPGVDLSILDPLRQYAGYGSGLMLSACAYWLLYKYMPLQKVTSGAALLGAVCAAVLWQSISPAFSYLLTRSQEINPFYGGLGGVVIFGLWAFWGAQVMLFGAQFAAAYEYVFVYRRPRGEDEAFIDMSRRRYQMAYLRDAELSAERLIVELQLGTQEAEQTPPGFNAIILGIGRLPHGEAERLGSELRGLVSVEGMPCAQRVAEAIRAVPGLNRLVLIGDKVSYMASSVADHVDAIIDEGPSTAYSLLRAIKFLAENRPILLVDADLPQMTTETLQDFVEAYDPEIELAYALTRRRRDDSYLSATGVFAPLRRGWVARTDLLVFHPRLAVAREDLVERFVTRRKDLWGMADTLGVAFVARFILGWWLPVLRYDVGGISHLIAAVTGARGCRGVRVNDAESLRHVDRIRLTVGVEE